MKSYIKKNSFFAGFYNRTNWEICRNYKWKKKKKKNKRITQKSGIKKIVNIVSFDRKLLAFTFKNEQ